MALAVVIAAIAVLVAFVQRPRNTSGNNSANTAYSITKEQLSKESIIRLTNDARALQGLAALNENDLLDAVAEGRARDLFSKQYFAHVSPTGEQASDIAQRVGYRYKIIAENLASGIFFRNQQIIDGWMQSPGHRRNILSDDVKDIGVSVLKGTLKGEDVWISVQVFGLQSPPVSEVRHSSPSQDLLREIETKKDEIARLGERVAKLRQELESESNSIELDRRIAGNDLERNRDLNARIIAYNEKSRWHNQSLAEMKAKETILNSMIEEYNKTSARGRGGTS